MRHRSNNPVHLNLFSLETAHPASPTGGNPVNFACPANARIRVTNITWTVGTVFNPNNPLIYIIPLAGSDILVSACDVAPDALTTTDYYFSPGIRACRYQTAENLLFGILPNNIFLEPGEILRITTTNIFIGHQITNCYISYDQWIIA